MQFDRILKNITGMSCPIFGLQWNPPTIESDEAKKVIVYLEDRRVLYRPSEMEDFRPCLQSIVEIRQELTSILKSLASDSLLAKSIKRMRSACRSFSDKIGHPKFSSFESPIQNSVLERELFKLREKFGLSLAEISLGYGQDVEDDLASIIPFNNAGNT